MTPSFALKRLQLASEDGRSRAARSPHKKSSVEGIVDRAFVKAVDLLEKAARKNGGKKTGEFMVREVFDKRAMRISESAGAISMLEGRFAAVPGVQVRRETRQGPAHARLWFIITWPAPIAAEPPH